MFNDPILGWFADEAKDFVKGSTNFVRNTYNRFGNTINKARDRVIPRSHPFRNFVQTPWNAKQVLGMAPHAYRAYGEYVRGNYGSIPRHLRDVGMNYFRYGQPQRRGPAPTRAYGEVQKGRMIYPKHNTMLRRWRKLRKVYRRRRFGRRRFGRRRMFSRKSTYNGDRYVRTNKRRRFKRYKRSGVSKNFRFNFLKMLSNNNIFRRMESGTVSWAHGGQAFYQSRLFKHTYDSAGGGAGSTYQDWNVVLDNLKSAYPSAAAGTTPGMTIYYSEWDQYNKTYGDMKVYTKAKMMHTFRNNSVFPLHLQVRVFIAKLDIPANASNTAITTSDNESDLIPQNLWKTYLDGSSGNLVSNVSAANLPGIQVAYYSDAKSMINQYWKLQTQEKIKLNPGEVYQKLVASKLRVINLAVLQKRHASANYGANNYGVFVFKGEPYLEVVIHGDIVHDNTTKSNVNYAGIESTDVNCGLDWTQRWETHAQQMPMIGKKQFFYQNNMGTVAAANITEPDITQFNDP